MPRDGMRREEPGRGPWCENKKKNKTKKSTNGGERKSRTSVIPWTSAIPRGGTRDVAPGRGPWSLKKKKEKERKRANEGSVSHGLILFFYPVK